MADQHGHVRGESLDIFIDFPEEEILDEQVLTEIDEAPVEVSLKDQLKFFYINFNSLQQ